MNSVAQVQPAVWVQFFRLTKPRVVSLIVFTAVIGMLLASPAVPPMGLLVAATVGIALVAGAAAAFNCLVEQKIDAVMARTRGRPLPRGEISSPQTLVFACAIGAAGLCILYAKVNALTMWLTLATFVGYAIVYTLVLKPLTPQNIVIGGASGAMPPVLGWTAVTGEIASDALILFLIIFAWTPPHFWALHGDKFTRLHVLLYTVILVAVTLMPFVTRMSGAIYLGTVLALDAVFLYYAVRIYVGYSDRLAQRTFRYSIFYLTALFAALLVDHYVRFPI
jgi:protoheme IX farnesyltransferase